MVLKKIILISFFILNYQFLFSQKNKITILANANVSFGRNYSNCRQPGNFCEFKTSTNKSTANTQVSFDKENNELTFIFSKTNLEETNKLKLLSNELEKDFYLYTFDEDFILPNDIKKALNIKDLSKIKKGNYLVKVNKDQIIMKLKLE